MYKIVSNAALFLILCASSATQAQQRGYAGLAIGPGKAGFGNAAGERIEHHNDVINFKAYAGYSLNEHFALEGGYAGTGSKPRFDKTRFGVAADPKADVSAVYAALRGSMAVSATVDLYAKLGVAHNHVELDGAGAQDVDVSAYRPMAGVGAAWRLTGNLALTAELEHYGRVREGSRRFSQNRAQVGIRFGF
jgi:OOP family OmpA-OmpF porin